MNTNPRHAVGLVALTMSACVCSSCDQAYPFARLALSGRTLDQVYLGDLEGGGDEQVDAPIELTAGCEAFEQEQALAGMDEGARAELLDECRAVLVTRAARQVQGVVKGCKAYFTSEQRYGDAWHEPGTALSESEGYPVAWVSYVPPGGAGYELTTQQTPNDEALPRGPQLDGAPYADAVVDTLSKPFASNGEGVPDPFTSPSIFTFKYRTGLDSGDGAWCEVYAEGPTGRGGEMVSLTQRMELDESQDAVISTLEAQGPDDLLLASGVRRLQARGGAAARRARPHVDVEAEVEDIAPEFRIALDAKRGDGDDGMPPAVKAAAPRKTVSALARMCRSYFVRTQRYTGGDGGEPWHVGGERGAEVPAIRKLFPGGTGQRLTSTPEVPRGGAPAPASPEARKHLDQTLALLGNPFKAPSIYQYVLETNPGMGAGARCVVTARTDLDPSSPEQHTLRQVVRMDPDTLTPLIEDMVETDPYE